MVYLRDDEIRFFNEKYVDLYYIVGREKQYLYF